LTKVNQTTTGAAMSIDPKGFVVNLPNISAYGVVERAISFRLKEDGVRYFLVQSDSNGNSVRDISTQYRSLTKMRRYNHLWMGDEETKKTHEQLKLHARRFYPDFVAPNDQSNPYPWVAFPMIGAAMKRSDLKAPLGVNLQVGSGLRAFTVKDMTSRIFGEAPKQLQAAAAESLVSSFEYVNLDNLTLASLLRGYLPPNALADILRMRLLQMPGIIQQMDKISANGVRLLLRRFSPQRITRLIKTFETDVRADMLLRDAANQYAHARKMHPDFVMDLGRQFRSLEELHQSITREYRKLGNPNVEISYSEKLTGDLESINLPGGATLVRPSCTHDLMDWASDNVMSNCIYSYGNDAVAGTCLLLGVLDGSGKMIINIMVRGQNVIQCYGRANERVTDEVLLEALFNSLIDANIISPDNNYEDWVGTGRGW
jgi:hypothetical protein